MPRHFLSPPKDEVALKQTILREGLPEGLEGLSAIQEKHGVDGASTALFHLLRRDHAAFIAEVEREEAAPSNTPANATLLLVPALYYRERPELGGDGERVLQAAQVCGFKARRVPSLSLGTVQQNAQILRDELANCAGDPILVVTLSVGALQVRHLLQGLGPGEPPAFQGWLNLAGTTFGAHAVERILSSPTRRLAGRVLARFQGLPFASVEESLPSHPLWAKPFPQPPGLRMVTVLPIPLESHVQKPLQARFEELKPFGPNDGMVLLCRSIPPGDVYPLWGCDHLVRSAPASEAVYRLLRWFRKHLGTAESPAPSQQPAQD